LTDDEKRAQVGGILFDIETTRKDLQHHRVQAEQMGIQLSELGSLLKQNPESIKELPPLHGPDYRPLFEALNREKVLAVANAVRELSDKLKQLEDQKTRLI
jgi:hypothetical protein